MLVMPALFTLNNVNFKFKFCVIFLIKIDDSIIPLLSKKYLKSCLTKKNSSALKI